MKMTGITSSGKSSLAGLVMVGRVVVTLFIASAFGSPGARAQDMGFSFGFKASITTASRLFTNPSSPDAFQRSLFFPIEDFFGYGVELRYRIPETNIAVGISSDYIRTTVSQSVRISTSKSIPVQDGYRVARSGRVLPQPKAWRARP